MVRVSVRVRVRVRVWIWVWVWIKVRVRVRDASETGKQTGGAIFFNAVFRCRPFSNDSLNHFVVFVFFFVLSWGCLEVVLGLTRVVVFSCLFFACLATLFQAYEAVEYTLSIHSYISLCV